MNLDQYQSHKEHTFDAFCKKVLANEARDYYNQKKFRLTHELSMSDLPPNYQRQVAVVDEYPIFYTRYDVSGFEICVKSDYWVALLDALPEKRRNIILLHYYKGMSDVEISKCLKIARTTIRYHRTTALQEIKRMIEELK